MEAARHSETLNSRTYMVPKLRRLLILDCVVLYEKTDSENGEGHEVDSYEVALYIILLIS